MPKAPKGSGEVAQKAKQLETLVVEYVAVGELQPNDYNPNRQSDHDFELLLRSMREDGFTQPVVALRSTGVIVDGEHRWRAGQALGMTAIPTVYVDMTPEQARISTLRHNRARGSEDVELAAAVLRDLAALGALDYAQEQLMLDDTEIERLMEDLSAPDALAGEAYNQAWQPSATDEEGRTNDEVNDSPQSQDTVVTASPGGGTQAQAMSASAIEANRVRERELSLARTAEERQAVLQEYQSFFRLMLIFQGDEATLVQSVLGHQAAETLIVILREHLDRHPELAAQPEQAEVPEVSEPAAEATDSAVEPENQAG